MPAFSPDGRTVLSGGHRDTIRLWDVATGKLVRTFEGHSDRVFSIALTPDGRTMLSGSEDNTLKLWNMLTGKLIRTLEGQNQRIEARIVWTIIQMGPASGLLSQPIPSLMKAVRALESHQ
jgi:WD40 repeat protein